MIEYVLRIETDSYAGNFERELCAYLTGQIGDCEVGDEYVEDDIHDLFYEFVYSKPDEYGCYRPVAISANEDKEYNDLDIYLFEALPNDLFDLVLKRIKNLHHTDLDGKFKVLGVKLIQLEIVTTTSVLKSIDINENNI